MSEVPVFKNFAEFWPFYVRQHSHPRTRLFHFIGTIGGLLLLTYTIWRFFSGAWTKPDFLWLLAALVFGYGFAWYAHFFIEKNRPATFTYPKWSFYADFKMAFYMLTGRMANEVKKASERNPLS